MTRLLRQKTIQADGGPGGSITWHAVAGDRQPSDTCVFYHPALGWAVGPDDEDAPNAGRPAALGANFHAIEVQEGFDRWDGGPGAWRRVPATRWIVWEGESAEAAVASLRAYWGSCGIEPYPVLDMVVCDL